MPSVDAAQKARPVGANATAGTRTAARVRRTDASPRDAPGRVSSMRSSRSEASPCSSMRPRGPASVRYPAVQELLRSVERKVDRHGEFLDEYAGLDVVQANVLGVAARQHTRAIGAVSDGVEALSASDVCGCPPIRELATAGCVSSCIDATLLDSVFHGPERQLPIKRRYCYLFRVGTKGNAEHIRRQLKRLTGLRPRKDIPQSNRTVPAAAGEAPSVCSEGQGHDGSFMAGEPVEKLASLHRPDVNIKRVQ